MGGKGQGPRVSARPRSQFIVACGFSREGPRVSAQPRRPSEAKAPSGHARGAGRSVARGVGRGGTGGTAGRGGYVWGGGSEQRGGVWRGVWGSGTGGTAGCAAESPPRTANMPRHRTAQTTAPPHAPFTAHRSPFSSLSSRPQNPPQPFSRLPFHPRHPPFI